MAGEQYDFLIRNARVFDGRGPGSRSVDVALKGDRIAAVGRIRPDRALHVIDGSGLILAPGFIDAHTHSDFNPLVYPALANKIFQGVTTEITGNCGMSAAPVLGEQAKAIRGVWAREGVSIGDSVRWKDFKGYRRAIEKAGMFTNLAALAGHGNIRAAVMGMSPRPASKDEIRRMREILKQALAEGAFGISFGLVYLPGIFANEEELAQLCREAGLKKGVCAFHLRSESSELLEAIGEALRIGQNAGARVQISHLKAGGKTNWPKIDQAFRLIEQARAGGLGVAADAYPYTATFAELGVILPDAIYQREDRLRYLADKSKESEILKELEAHYRARGTDWGRIMVAATPHKKFSKYEGRTLREIAQAEGKTPEKALLDLLNGTSLEISAFNFSQDEGVVAKVMGQNYVAPGSDSIADGSRKPHPRAFGTFPKILKSALAAGDDAGLAATIGKMTSLPANHFRIKERGAIAPGFYADLVLLDPALFSDTATYENPRSLSRGIRWIWVNGTPVIEDGRFKGRKEGRFLTP